MRLDLAQDSAEYVVKRIDPASGRITVEPGKIKGGQAITLPNGGRGRWWFGWAGEQILVKFSPFAAQVRKQD